MELTEENMKRELNNLNEYFDSKNLKIGDCIHLIAIYVAFQTSAQEDAERALNTFCKVVRDWAEEIDKRG